MREAVEAALDAEDITPLVCILSHCHIQVIGCQFVCLHTRCSYGTAPLLQHQGPSHIAVKAEIGGVLTCRKSWAY